MKTTGLLGIAFVLGCNASPALGASFNAVSQFNPAHNTAKGVWSYRYGDGNGHDGKYSLLTSKGTFSVLKGGKTVSLKDWDSPDNGFTVPLFVANKPNAKVTFSSNGQQVAIRGRTMLYHPGYGFPAILSFLASTAGTVSITYDFTALDWSCGDNGAGIDWSIERNSGNGALASGHLVSNTENSIESTGTQIVSTPVAVGDRVNFIVDGVANPPNCASTGIQVLISEP